MAQSLVELIEQFCRFQRKQKGKTEEGVETYRRWLEYFLTYVRSKEGRLARVTDLNAARIQAWMDDMAANDLATSTISGMRRGSVASLRVRHLNGDWGLCGVRVKGGKSRDIPPTPAGDDVLA